MSIKSQLSVIYPPDSCSEEEEDNDEMDYQFSKESENRNRRRNDKDSEFDEDDYTVCGSNISSSQTGKLNVIYPPDSDSSEDEEEKEDFACSQESREQKEKEGDSECDDYGFCVSNIPMDTEVKTPLKVIYPPDSCSEEEEDKMDDSECGDYGFCDSTIPADKETMKTLTVIYPEDSCSEDEEEKEDFACQVSGKQKEFEDGSECGDYGFSESNVPEDTETKIPLNTNYPDSSEEEEKENEVDEPFQILPLNPKKIIGIPGRIFHHQVVLRNVDEEAQRLAFLVHLLNETKEPEQILVFISNDPTHSPGLFERIRKYLSDHGFGCLTLDGSIAQRARACKDFADGYRNVLILEDAGSFKCKDGKLLLDEAQVLNVRYLVNFELRSPWYLAERVHLVGASDLTRVDVYTFTGKSEDLDHNLVWMDYYAK